MLSLSRQFIGHEQDVRSVATTGDIIFSCSRDGTVREWQIKPSATTETQQYRTHTGFVNSLAYHDGYIISGGQDSTINLVKPGATEPSYALLGHTANVCALDVSQDGTIISGSWDGTARSWKEGVCIETMEGHTGAVWAVLWTEHGILTGGADRSIRLWKDGKQIKNYPAGKDCVRALSLHPLGFVSAGNDSIIRIHTFDGEIVQELEGHDSFIYSLATTPGGDIYSVGEDRSLRHWHDGSLKQSITHPAVSVWTVAIMDNGDIVTGSSDSIVRLFTFSNDRKASAEECKAFDDSVAASTIPSQTTNIPNNLPGLEALSGPGSKEGEVKMIRTSPDLVEAHQWSGGVWTKIGEVMGATSKKVEYEGKDYDFVFDVDIAEGQPPLKLPYNTEENPYEAANRFITKYELDVGFQGQIVKFIESNTGGMALGVPKDVPASSTSSTTAVLTPQRSYLSMLAGNSQPILDKLKALSAEVSPAFSISCLLDLDTSKPSDEQITCLLKILKEFPRNKRFPALDLLRLSLPKIDSNVSMEDVLTTVLEASEFQADMIEDKVREANIMLALRCLTNMHTNVGGIKVLRGESDTLQELTSNLSFPNNRNLSLAYSTYLLNSAVLTFNDASSILALNLIGPLLTVIREATDSEVQYRALVGLGTLLRISEDVKVAANDVFEAAKTVRSIDQKEDRIIELKKEILDLLK